jgi:hypothetical protein
MSRTEIDPVSWLTLPVICKSRKWGTQLSHYYSYPIENFHLASKEYIPLSTPLLVMDIVRRCNINDPDNHPDDCDNIYLALDYRGRLIEVAGRFLCPLDN